MAIANLVREGKTHQIPGMIQVGKKKGNQPLDDAIMDHLRQMRISPEEAYDKSIDKKKFRPFLKDSASGRVRRVGSFAMRTPDLDRILSAMLKTHDGISDLNFSVGRPLQVEDSGELKSGFGRSANRALTAYQTEQLALVLMQGNRRLMHDFSSTVPAIAATRSTMRPDSESTFFGSKDNSQLSCGSCKPVIPTTFRPWTAADF